MKQYTVWFEMYGKKMKTTVTAINEHAVRLKVMAEVKFYKVEQTDSIKDIFRMFGDIFNPKNK